jgi:flagellar basal body rod protein FlgC
LLRHDHHEDNLDKTGRAFLPKANRVLTMTSGEKRLHSNAKGLANWQSTILESVRPFAGQTIGFMLEWEGQQNGALYITSVTIHTVGTPIP